MPPSDGFWYPAVGCRTYPSERANGSFEFIFDHTRHRLAVVSWVLLLIVSWKEEFAWGMCSLLLPPVGYGYAFFRMDKASSVIAFAAAGWIMIWLGW